MSMVESMVSGPVGPMVRAMTVGGLQTPGEPSDDTLETISIEDLETTSIEELENMPLS